MLFDVCSQNLANILLNNPYAVFVNFFCHVNYEPIFSTKASVKLIQKETVFQVLQVQKNPKTNGKILLVDIDN